MSEAPTQFPHQVGGKVTTEIRAMMDEANQRFGVTDGALVRMALAAYLPGYLAVSGRVERLDLVAKLSAAIDANPAVAAELEQFLARASRTRRTSRTAA